METTKNITVEDVWKQLDQVTDPEIPVLTVRDLGIIRKVEVENDTVIVHITPTYSGCPAMDVIKTNIRMSLLALGAVSVEVRQVLSPAWTTDWMSEDGKKKLREYGIAPPNPRQQVCNNDLFAPHEAIQCPQCNSYKTTRVSEFGSTPCKSLFVCEECHEPFDYFKCH